MAVWVPAGDTYLAGLGGPLGYDVYLSMTWVLEVGLNHLPGLPIFRYFLHTALPPILLTLI